MKYVKYICLMLIVSVGILGCSKEKVSNVGALSEEEYHIKLESIVKKIFEEENYKNKDVVLGFENDMYNKIKNDTENNKWYYEDQLYLVKVKNLYNDFVNEIKEINSSDDIIESMHKSLVLQVEDIISITSELLNDYNENNPQELNNKVPNIKLIFTYNPNSYRVTDIVTNEINGRIKRINNTIESIIKIDVKDISRSDVKEDNKESENINNKTIANTNNEAKNINKAKELVYKTTGENKNEVDITYQSNPGTMIDSNKYYAFDISPKDGSFVYDIMYLVEKSTFEVYEFDSSGKIYSISSKKSNTEDTHSTNINSNQIPGGITCKEALEKLINSYGEEYRYVGSPNGEISYEMFNTVKGIEEPSYLFGFKNKSTGDGYVGWVYGDGSYAMKAYFD